ncbi:phage holin family protein [Mariniluteicoccus flavus]
MAHEYVPSDDRTSASATPGVGDIVKLISEDVKTLVRGEIELAKSELVPSAKHAGVGAGLFGGAGYFGLNGVSLLFIAGALGFAKLFGSPTGWIALGFVVMAVIMFVIAGILALVGKSNLAKVKGPERAQAHAEATITQAKAAITRANADVKTAELERKNF